MKKVIFVAGNSHGIISPIVLKKAYQLGKLIGESGHVLLTGGTLGIPEEAAMGALQVGGLTVSISPGNNISDHIENYNQSDKSDIYIYTGMGDMGRNFLNVKSCDAVIIIGGGMGTLSEFCIAYAEGKLIGILENTGGIADKIKEIIEATNKKPKNDILFSESPSKLFFEIKKAIEK